MTLQAQVIFPRDTGVAQDVAVNNWYFGGIGSADDQAAFDDIFGRLSAFYQDIHGVFGLNVKLNQATCKIFNMDDPSPGREPTYEAALTGISNSTNDPAPSQVAICLSYKGPPTGGQPARRSRGRVFLGPVSRSNESSSDRDRIDTGVIDQIMDAAVAHLPAPGAGDAGEHVVFSRGDYIDSNAVLHAKSPSQADDHAHPVTTYWVDNRFDTQRRRAKKATFRDLRTP